MYMYQGSRALFGSLRSSLRARHLLYGVAASISSPDPSEMSTPPSSTDQEDKDPPSESDPCQEGSSGAGASPNDADVGEATSPSLAGNKTALDVEENIDKHASTGQGQYDTSDSDQSAPSDDEVDKRESQRNWFAGIDFFSRLFRPSIEKSYSSDARRYDGDYWASLPLPEKRQQYRCGRNYVTLERIPTWEKVGPGFAAYKPKQPSPHTPSASLNAKISLWKGDITTLEIDAIVNAANSSLLGGGGVDGAIHRAAGNSLRRECVRLNGCDAGDAKLTHGHKLPAKYILHTVGPMNRSEVTLISCYTSCLNLVEQHEIRSVAFCCVSTGIYGYPNREAAHVALRTIREWLETDDNADKVDRIIFCVFLDTDYSIYRRLLHHYFPLCVKEAANEDKEVGRQDMEVDAGVMGEALVVPQHVGEAPVIPQLARSVTEPAHRSSGPSVVQEGTSQQEVGVVDTRLEGVAPTDTHCADNSPSHDPKRPKTED